MEGGILLSYRMIFRSVFVPLFFVVSAFYHFRQVIVRILLEMNIYDYGDYVLMFFIIRLQVAGFFGIKETLSH